MQLRYVGLFAVAAISAMLGYRNRQNSRRAAAAASAAAVAAQQAAEMPTDAPAAAPGVTPRGGGGGGATTEALAPTRDFATIQERIREGAPGTYILHMLEGLNHEIRRWPDRRLEPLRVWIQREASLANWNPSYHVMAERAFDEWRDAGFPIRFDRVPDSTTADIKIVFVHQMPATGDPAIGQAEKERDREGWIRTARVTIAIHGPDGSPLSPELIAGIARHEVGHVLGLGHSNNPTDVMYPQANTPIISATDIATLKLVYLLPPGPVK